MNKNQCLIVSDSTTSYKVYRNENDQEQRSRLYNRIIVVVLLLSSLVLIKCISINNAFPFEMMQIYSKPEEPKRGSNNDQLSYMSPRGNIQPQQSFQQRHNQPASHHSMAPSFRNVMRSTTQRPSLPVTSGWSTSITTSSTEPTTSSTTTTTMKPTTKKVRRIKLPNSFSSSKPKTQVKMKEEEKKDDENTNKIIDEKEKGGSGKKVPQEKVSEEKKKGEKKMTRKEEKTTIKGKSQSKESSEKKKKNEEGKVDKKEMDREEERTTEYEPEFDSKVVKVTNYDVKKKAVQFPSKGKVLVETRSGRIEGMKGKVMDHEVNSFLGVPYAVPPIESLRFRKPLSVKPWNGIYNATSFKPHCLQTFQQDITLARTLTTLFMSEDCLYLNIWTPSLKPEKLKTVMVWIYGGGFKSGSANYDETDGRVLSALGDVVVVTFNYRIGAFGFLDTGTKDSPGNQGLYDAVEALSWVRDNIKSFGGDPNEITLFGHYSGAVMIGLLMVSENTKYWFKRAILQSGSPLFQDFFDGKNARTSQLLTEKIGCKEIDKRKELKCLRNKTMEEILDVQSPLLAGDKNLFAPTNCEDLISTTVIDAIKSSIDDVMSNEYFSGIESVMMGSNKDELSVSLVMGFPEMFTTKRVNLNLTTLTELRELVVEIFSKGNSGSSFSSGMNEKKFVKFLAELFFTEGKEVDTTDNLIKRMYRVFGDAAVACPVTIFGEHLFKMGKTVYLYEFNQRAFNTPWGDWMGVTFSTEIPYIFGHPLRYPKIYSKDDLVISRRLIQTWSMFAKSGKVPMQKNVTWEPFSDSLQEFIEINPHHAHTGTRDKNEVCNLFRVTIDNTNSSSLNCSERTSDENEVDLRFTDTDMDGEGMETTTTDEDVTTEEPTEPPIIACELFQFYDPREPSVDYIQYEVIDLQIVAILNTSAVFHCDEGEEIVGEQVSRCTEDGTWTSPKPTCRRVVYPKGVIPSSTVPRFTCEFFQVPEDSPLGPVITYENYVLMNDTDMYAVQGTIARFACKTQGNDLVKLFGQSIITCGKYGIWDSIEPECKVVDETKEIKIIEKDIKNQLVIIGLILLVVIAIVYVTFTLYIRLDKRNQHDERPSLHMQSLTPDSNQGYYYNRGRVSTNSSDRETELEPREDELLLRINEEFNEGSEISPEDMEIIDILAKARDDSASIVSRPASKQLDNNMNIIRADRFDPGRRSFRSSRHSSRRSSRLSSRVSSRTTRSTVISDEDGRMSTRSSITEVTRCNTRTSGGGTSSSEPETVLWVYK